MMLLLNFKHRGEPNNLWDLKHMLMALCLIAMLNRKGLKHFPMCFGNLRAIKIVFQRINLQLYLQRYFQRMGRACVPPCSACSVRAERRASAQSPTSRQPLAHLHCSAVTHRCRDTARELREGAVSVAPFWTGDIKALLKSLLCRGGRQLWRLLASMTEGTLRVMSFSWRASLKRKRKRKGLVTGRISVLPDLCALLNKRSSTKKMGLAPMGRQAVCLKP